MTKDVSSKVKKMVSDHLGIDENKVTDEANFIDDLGGKSSTAQDPTVEIQNAPVSRELKYQASFMQSLSSLKIHWPEIQRK